MPSLRPCPECNRHIACEDVSCRFCSAEIEPVAARPAAAVSQLGRAARMAMGAAALATGVTLAGCGDDDGPSTRDASADSATDSSAQPTPDADNTTIAAPYGAPPSRERLA